MQEVAPQISMIDTLLGGMEGVTASYLVAGESVALVDPGARTSAGAVREALAAAGLGPDDLRWIVLTHVHLDHCGATGILAAAFPRATVVVHRRGARHLAEPARLVAGTAAVHGPRWSLYGGLDRTPAERITAAEDGHRVDLGGGRALRMVATPGHARHHMAVLDEVTGTVVAGDALGVSLGDGGLYPVLPPAEVDLAAGHASLRRLAEIAPERLCLTHYGPVADPMEAIDLAHRQLDEVERAAREAAPGALAESIERRLPLEATVGAPAGVALWRRLGWATNNVDGVAGWLAAHPEGAPGG